MEHDWKLAVLHRISDGGGIEIDGPVQKVGPKGYIHGWIYVGTDEPKPDKVLTHPDIHNPGTPGLGPHQAEYSMLQAELMTPDSTDMKPGLHSTWDAGDAAHKAQGEVLDSHPEIQQMPISWFDQVRVAINVKLREAHTVPDHTGMGYVLYSDTDVAAATAAGKAKLDSLLAEPIHPVTGDSPKKDIKAHYAALQAHAANPDEMLYAGQVNSALEFAQSGPFDLPEAKANALNDVLDYSHGGNGMPTTLMNHLKDWYKANPNEELSGGLAEKTRFEDSLQQRPGEKGTLQDWINYYQFHKADGEQEDYQQHIGASLLRAQMVGRRGPPGSFDGPDAPHPDESAPADPLLLSTARFAALINQANQNSGLQSGDAYTDLRSHLMTDLPDPSDDWATAKGQLSGVLEGYGKAPRPGVDVTVWRRAAAADAMRGSLQGDQDLKHYGTAAVYAYESAARDGKDLSDPKVIADTKASAALVAMTPNNPDSFNYPGLSDRAGTSLRNLYATNPNATIADAKAEFQKVIDQVANDPKVPEPTRFRLLMGESEGYRAGIRTDWEDQGKVGLSTPELRGWNDYMSFGYKAQNGFLRGLPEYQHDPVVARHVSGMDQTFANHGIVTTEPTEVERVVASTKDFTVSRWKPGKVVPEPAFVSTTTTPDARDTVAMEGHLRDKSLWTMHITAPPGSTWIPGTVGENEMIWPRGSVTTITGVDKDSRIITATIRTPTHEQLLAAASVPFHIDMGPAKHTVTQGGAPNLQALVDQHLAQQDLTSGFEQMIGPHMEKASRKDALVLDADEVEPIDGPVTPWQVLQATAARYGQRLEGMTAEKLFHADQLRDERGRWTVMGGETHREITADEARGNSRPVTRDEFQKIAADGRARLDKRERDGGPARALHGHRWQSIKDHSWTEVQKSWGGTTIDSHTGEPVPQGAREFALSIKDPHQESVSMPEGADRATFDKAMDEARQRFDSQLQMDGAHLGVFHDDDEGRIDIDPVLVVDNLSDVETIGAATHAIGGAYCFADGNGYWPPHVGDVSGKAGRPHYQGIGQWFGHVRKVQK